MIIPANADKSSKMLWNYAKYDLPGYNNPFSWPLRLLAPKRHGALMALSGETTTAY
jgi:hypothetical protein